MINQTIALEDILYDKSFECPICFHSFTSKAIKLNKNRVLSTDIDLYSHYSVVNPLLYDIILCPCCGYCALQKTFSKLLPTQVSWIKDNFVAQYKKRTFSQYTTIEESIIKHKLALTCAIIKKGKIGEQAYLALHIAWLYRDLEQDSNEKNFLERALWGLIKASESEKFPIINLESNTALYIIAVLSYKLEDYELSKRYLSVVIQSTYGQLKERALDLKAILNEQC